MRQQKAIASMKAAGLIIGSRMSHKDGAVFGRRLRGLVNLVSTARAPLGSQDREYACCGNIVDIMKEHGFTLAETEVVGKALSLVSWSSSPSDDLLAFSVGLWAATHHKDPSFSEAA